MFVDINLYIIFRSILILFISVPYTTSMPSVIRYNALYFNKIGTHIYLFSSRHNVTGCYDVIIEFISLQ